MGNVQLVTGLVGAIASEKPRNNAIKQQVDGDLRAEPQDTVTISTSGQEPTRKVDLLSATKQSIQLFKQLYREYKSNPTAAKKNELTFLASEILNKINKLLKNEETEKEADKLLEKFKAKAKEFNVYYLPKGGIASKLLQALKTCNFSHIMTQAQNKIDPEVFHRYAGKKIERTASDYSPQGYVIDSLYLAGLTEEVGTVFVFQSEKAQADFTRGSGLIKEKEPVLYCSGPYFFDRDHPSGLSAVNGNFLNKYVNGEMQGLVIIRNGGLQISRTDESGGNLTDVDSFTTLLNSVEQGQLSVFQGHLLVHDGKNAVALSGSSMNRELRRILVVFNDNSFGVVDLSREFTLYETASFLVQLGVKAAVNLDTGNFNTGGFRVDNKGEIISLGKTREEPPFALNFYTR